MQKRSIQGFAFPVLALILIQVSLEVGCGGSDGSPPTLSQVSTTAVDIPTKIQQVETTTSTGANEPSTGVSCTEGVVESCKTPIAARDGFYLCGQGHRTCRSNAWSSCETEQTSAGEDEWTPINVGCDIAPEPCASEGATRDCVQHLPPSAPGENNCYHGEETCQKGAWSTCVQK